MKKEFRCCVCGKTKKYSPLEYAGYSEELKGDICKPCRESFRVLKEKQNKELEEWLESKKVNATNK
jgi:hypothetical protein